MTIDNGMTMTFFLFFFCIDLFRDTRMHPAGYWTSIHFDFKVFRGHYRVDCGEEKGPARAWVVHMGYG